MEVSIEQRHDPPTVGTTRVNLTQLDAIREVESGELLVTSQDVQGP